MRPKGKLLALLAIFAAIGLVTATGAFTTVSAQRTAEVNVAGDSSALVAIEANETSPNGEGAYARSNSGQFELVLNNSVNPGEGGVGLNQDAQTSIDHVFNVTNQGTQSVTVYAEITSNNGNVNVGQSANAPKIYLYAGGDTSTSLTGSGNTVTLSTGSTQSIGVYVDTTGLDDSATLDLTITIYAEA